MTLGSNLFRGNSRLARCAISDPAHVVTGDAGEHVRLIQIALGVVDGATIDESEIKASRYGKSTADAVLAYKQARDIINRSYQKVADDIVGKMTIAQLDQDMLSLQVTPGKALSKRCEHIGVARVPPPRRRLGTR